MGPVPTPSVSLPLFPISSLGISPSKLLTTLKTPPLLTLPPPAPTQPSKHSSPLAINLDPVELIFSTPPTFPHAFFDSLKDLPPKTTNPPLHQPSFKSIECLANQTSPLLTMEPPLPPQLLPLRPNNPFYRLTDTVVVRDFYKKFYNSLGRVPNRYSSSIGKTRGLLSFSRGICW
nr:hypothetical protein [Tanacetum cinerariifolium]